MPTSRNTNFPRGFPYGVNVRGVPLLSAYPGNVFWVDSNGGANIGKGTFDRPFATIDYAVGRCAAGNGDVIMVKAGHVETVTAAAGLALDVSSIALVGLGAGSHRPTVNFTTAVGASIAVTAANITITNFLFTGGIDALTGPLTIGAADCALLNCEFRDVTGQATDAIVADATSHRLLVDGYFHNGAAAAGANSAIALTGMTNPVIRNFKIVGNFAVSAIDCRTTAVIDLEIYRGYIWTKNAADLCIKDTITASTGKIGPDLEFMLTDNAANITEAVTGATFHLFDPVYVCNLVNEKGLLINWVASTDA